jgi:glutaredoxin
MKHLLEKRYTLYVSNDCVQCANVEDYLKRKAIECLVINVDTEGDNPPQPAFIFPVLYKNDEPLAYGLDIIEHFQMHTNRP